MTMKTMKIALAAVAVLGVSAATAQEMGAASTSVASVATVAATPAVVPPQAHPVTVPVATAGAMAIPEDDGPKVVVENQAYAPAVSAPKGTDVMKAVHDALRDRKFKQGYDPERGCIIQIGQASVNMNDPSSPDFMIMRELFVREAELDAKIQIAGAVRQKMSGSMRVNTPGTKEREDFLNKYKDQIAALEQQKAKVAELLQQLEKSESDLLAETTVDKRWKYLMDGIIKRLDAKYSKDDIEVEKQQQYLKIKAAYDQAKVQLDDLKQKQDAYPRRTDETEAQSYAEMKLCGSVDLVQAESWDGKWFQVAVAVVWSPKLQERALLTLGCGVPVGGKDGEKSLDAWLRDQADGNALSRVVGTRQYIDDRGRQYVLGFSAVEVPTDAADYADAVDEANLLAKQAVGFYLYSEGDGSAEVKAEAAQFGGGKSARGADNFRKKLNAEFGKKMDLDKNKGDDNDFSISGLSNVFGARCKNELSGKEIYVSVAAVDSVLAGKSSGILRQWYSGAAEAIAAGQYRSNEQKGMSQVVEAVKKSDVAAKAGLAAGQQAVIGELKARQAERNPVAPSTPATVAPVTHPATPSAPKKGVFVGGQNFSDDF